VRDRTFASTAARPSQLQASFEHTFDNTQAKNPSRYIVYSLHCMTDSDIINVHRQRLLQ